MSKLKILSNFYAPYLEEFDIVLYNGNRNDSDYFQVQPTVLFSEIMKNLPDGWEPDFVLYHTPFYYRIPVGIEDCPWPTVAVLDDWFGGVDFMPDVLGWFDHIVTDCYSLRLLQERRIFNCSYWASFGHDDSRFRQLDTVQERDIDVAFIGNLNGNIQYERFQWLRRIAEMKNVSHSVIGEGVYGDEYVSILNRAKIGFNKTIKGEMNLRCFEVPACGALLFVEEENEEICAFLTPGEECILYNTDNLEYLIEYYLKHDDERERIARAGQEKIAQFTYRNNYRNLLSQLQNFNIIPGENRRSGQFYTPDENHLHLFQTAIGGSGQDANLLNRIAHFLNTPEGMAPLFLNDAGVLIANYAERAKITDDVQTTTYQQALSLFDAAIASQPTLVTVKFNRIQVLARLGKVTESITEAVRFRGTTQGELVGQVFPLSYEFPLRYLWSQALVEPERFDRLKLLQYFAQFSIVDMLEFEKEFVRAADEIEVALKIYDEISYGIKRFATTLRTIGQEERFIPWIDRAVDVAPFDNHVVICSIKALEKSGGGSEFKERYRRIYNSVTEGTKEMLFGVEQLL